MSADHDSEVKRVQDMLSTIEKPQVGTHTFSHTHTHAHTTLINHLLSEAVVAGTMINILGRHPVFVMNRRCADRNV